MRRNINYRVGLDIGSTTLKCVVLDGSGALAFHSYARHGSKIAQQVSALLERVREVTGGGRVQLAISGSAGMGIADACGVPFLQEVYATRIALAQLLPQTDVAIELGGEDAKILFLTGGLEVRMNGTCAGGTGAFIDQMATLLGVDAAALNELAKDAREQYTIASRCGVFAKSDIQPLLNQGARKEDIAKSIFLAVVNQTIGGLTQGRPITGNVAYLGGPLFFLSELRKSFDDALHTKGNCPENGLYFVALGAALRADSLCDLDALLTKIRAHQANSNYFSAQPLFKDQADYQAFVARHASHRVPRGSLDGYQGKTYLGIDAGSTTVKMALVDEAGQLLYSSYQSNAGNPVPLIREQLLTLYENHPGLTIAGGAATGYGEDLAKAAFGLSHGIVETVAHCRAAQSFLPEVDFIIDIGGQDMKCLQVKDGVIDSIFLNEACSSGCGSFLQSFASALGYSIEDFAKLGLFAQRPVDLGSRCTVFMNSSVKQAQKDGASIENISAGLSISVVKNALYKVIRTPNKEALGRHIVVQGGTFLSDAVLRAFEQELETEVIRPDIAGLMGAYGAALYALEEKAKGICSREELAAFTHTVQDARCGLCSNNCRLTINRFSNGRSYISGNRCERPITHKKAGEALDLYADKQKLLRAEPIQAGNRGTIGIPMGLNMYELLPFWQAFFGTLGFKTILSPPSTHALYVLGEGSLPSDTVCFPAKLMHGHVQWLLDQGVDTIFYPCMTYNLDEKLGDRHFNCPVVAYYPEVIGANMAGIKNVRFLSWYLGLHNPKALPGKLREYMKEYWPDITLPMIRSALTAAYDAYAAYMQAVRDRSDAIVKEARQAGKPIIVLAGRPYHVDPEINHGIDRLITALGAAVITEDALGILEPKHPAQVLNQWTYHARLYAAAHYITRQPDMYLVQLVSFGCGLDAITTDEVRRILEEKGCLYTQIKIDEITNLGAVRIRLRSLLAAVESGKAKEKGAS